MTGRLDVGERGQLLEAFLQHRVLRGHDLLGVGADGRAHLEHAVQQQLHERVLHLHARVRERRSNRRVRVRLAEAWKRNVATEAQIIINLIAWEHNVASQAQITIDLIPWEHNVASQAQIIINLVAVWFVGAPGTRNRLPATNVGLHCNVA